MKLKHTNELVLVIFAAFKSYMRPFLKSSLIEIGVSLAALLVKNPPAMQETPI